MVAHIYITVVFFPAVDSVKGGGVGGTTDILLGEENKKKDKRMIYIHTACICNAVIATAAPTFFSFLQFQNSV